MCFQMAIRAIRRKKQTTTFCLSTSLKDTFRAVVTVKKRIYRVCTTVYPATITEDKTDDNTLHIYIFWGGFINFYEFFFVIFVFFRDLDKKRKKKKSVGVLNQ